jgi:hypothetical protein
MCHDEAALCDTVFCGHPQHAAKEIKVETAAAAGNFIFVWNYQESRLRRGIRIHHVRGKTISFW